MSTRELATIKQVETDGSYLVFQVETRKETTPRETRVKEHVASTVLLYFVTMSMPVF
jgi:hypothetical protein